MFHIDVGYNFEKKVLIKVPEIILATLEYMASKTEDEYSIILHAKEIEGGYELSSTFRIPKQEVTTVSIDYKESCKPENAVIHRHPDGANKFSSTDEEFINQNFVVSLLFTEASGFVGGQVNLKLGDNTFIQVPTYVEIIPAHIGISGSITLPTGKLSLSRELLNPEILKKLLWSKYEVDMRNIIHINTETNDFGYEKGRDGIWGRSLPNSHRSTDKDTKIMKYENGKDYTLVNGKFVEEKYIPLLF